MSFNDNRVLFYMKHREQIEAWAALRKEATAAIDAWMSQLKEPILELAAGLAPSNRVQVVASAEKDWPAFFLVDSAWGFAPSDSPPAAIALCWNRVQTRMIGTDSPYFGVRSSSGHEIGRRLRAVERFTPARKARNETTTLWWAALRYVVAGPGFPNAENAETDYRDKLIDGLRSAWTTYAPMIEEVAKATPLPTAGAVGVSVLAAIPPATAEFIPGSEHEHGEDR